MLTKYIHKLGVSPLWSVVDVYGLDPEILEFIPKPVKAVILLYPLSDDVGLQSMGLNYWFDLEQISFVSFLV